MRAALIPSLEIRRRVFGMGFPLLAFKFRWFGLSAATDSLGGHPTRILGFLPRILDGLALLTRQFALDCFAVAFGWVLSSAHF